MGQEGCRMRLELDPIEEVSGVQEVEAKILVLAA